MALVLNKGLLSQRSRLLLASSMAALTLGSVAGQANDVSVGGVSNPITNIFNLPPFYIYSSTLTLGTPVEVNVDTVALNGSSVAATVGVNANSAITVNISKDVTNPLALPGVWVFNNGFMTNTDAMLVNVISGATVSSVGNHGIYAGGGFANGPVSITSDGTGVVKGGLSGVVINTLLTQTGTVKVEGFNGITGTTQNGVWIANYGAGDIEVKNNGDINAGIEGIWTAAVGGNTTIDTTDGKVTAGLDGIAHSWGGYTAGNTGAGSVDIKTADVEAGGVGVFAYTLSGNNSIDTTAGTIDAGLDGVDGWVFIGAGNVDIKTADVFAVREGVWSRAWDGNTTVDTTAGKVESTAGDGVIHATVGYAVGSNLGNADITTGDVKAALNGVFSYTNSGTNTIDTSAGTVEAGLDGVVGWALGGDVDITTGKVTGGEKGIWASNVLGGANTVTALGDVSGNLTADWGIYSGTVNGDNTVNIKGVKVVGNAAVEATTIGTGNVLTTIDAGSVLDGTTWGYATTTVTGVGVTNNAGTIRTVGDNGLSGDTGLSATVWVKGGINNTINNNAGGMIFGGFTDAGLNTIFNNNTGAVWDAALLNAMNATSRINNTGIINIRQGATVGVGVTDNEAGGLFDLTYGGTSPLATDYVYTYGYNALGGSTTKFNVDFTLANGSGTEALADDHSSNGLGTADTIGSIANPTPSPGAKISLVYVGAPGVATSGSVALILPAATGGFGMVDPGLGGLATLIPSTNYVFDAGSDPTSGAVKVVLQEDAFGGVYLRWAPNITADSMGGFTGGNPASGRGGAAQAVAGAGGASGGISGGIGGGPGGGGVAGGVADSAAANAQSNNGCHVGKDLSSDTYSSNSYAWMSGTGSKTKIDGGGKASDFGGAIGVEHDLAGALGMGCGDLKIGMFGHIGEFSSAHATGTAKGSAKGLGAYIEAASDSGLYASVLGATSWSETELTNAVFGSTAKQDAVSYVATASIGYTREVMDNVWFDIRAFASIAHNDGDGFTDSAGITVDYTKSDVRTFGLMSGMSAELGEGVTAFARSGVKWVSMDSQSSAFGIVIDGKAKVMVRSVEAGLNANLNDSTTLSASAFGDFTKASTSYGGELALKFKF